MPMIDAFIPAGALAPAAEAALIEELTDTLLRHEAGLDPANDRARSVSLVFLHRPASVYVGGRLATDARYRFVVCVPEGQFEDEAVLQSLVHQVTGAVARAERQPFDDVAPRVWVFPFQIPDGTWGGRGVIRRLPEIVGWLVGEQGAEAARQRLARHRRHQALAVLRAVTEGGGAWTGTPRR